MEERIEFTDNPNGKLNTGSFALIRLSHPVKNAIRSVKQIYQKGIWKGNAQVIYTRQIYLSDITPEISYLVADMPPEALRQQIRLGLKNRPGINWLTQPLDYIILQYIKESKEPTLFK